MQAQIVLAELRGLGVNLSVDQQRLRLKAPPGVLTEEVKAAITAEKPTIIALLQQESRRLRYRQRQQPVIRDSSEADQVQVDWSDEVQAAIDWLTQSELPESFQLSQGVFVLDGAKIREVLLRDAEVGPGGPRARWGALQGDLLRLHGLFSVERTDAVASGPLAIPGD
jgi:hypothetical protein